MLKLIKLEDRIVLDGAAVIEAAEQIADQIAAESLESLAQLGDAAAASDIVGEVADAVSDAALAPIEEKAAALFESAAVDADLPPLKILLVADDLKEPDVLAAAFASTHHVIVYDAQTDSVAKIIEQVKSVSAASGRQIDSLSLMSHGSGGQVQLGNEALSAGNLSQNADSWMALSDVLTEDASIELFGCNVVDGTGRGQALLDGLADATGSDVFGSDDITGVGGDWVLEHGSQGAILVPEITPMAMAHVLENYTGSMPSPSTTSSILWLKADTGLFSDDSGTVAATNGGTVAHWADQSGQNNDMVRYASGNGGVTYSTDSMINGVATVNFSGTNSGLMADLAGMSTTAGDKVTVFFVGQSSEGGFRTFYSFGAATDGVDDTQALILLDSGATWNRALGINTYNGSGTGINSSASGGPTGSAHTGSLGLTTVEHTNNAAGVGDFGMWTDNLDRTTSGAGSTTEIEVNNIASSASAAMNTTFSLGNLKQTDTTSYGATFSYEGNIQEVLVYNGALGDAERNIVSAYLAAKYGFDLDANSKYSHATAGSGVDTADYDQEVNGIGKEASDTVSSGVSDIATISNASSMTSNGDYLMFGHNGGTTTGWSTVSITGGETKWATNQEWRVDTSGSGVGTVTVTFDVSGLPDHQSGTVYRLVVDSDGDGNYTSGTTVYTTADTGGTRAFTGVTIADGAVFKIVKDNTAPSLNGDSAMSDVTEDSTPAGQTVSAVVNAQVSDSDTGDSFNGIVVTGNTANSSTEGVWQYNTDGTWRDIGTVSGNLGLVLSSSTNIRFLPVADFAGTATALSIRAIDSTYTDSFTAGATRVTQDTSVTNGGSSPYSGSTRSITQNVTGEADAPTIDLDSGDASNNYSANTGAGVNASLTNAGTISDPDSANLDFVTMTITGLTDHAASSEKIVFEADSNVTMNLGASSAQDVVVGGTTFEVQVSNAGSTTATIMIDEKSGGDISIANYQSLLQTMKYRHEVGGTSGDRVFVFKADTGSGTNDESALVTSTITLSTSAIPVVDLDPNNDNAAGNANGNSDNDQNFTNVFSEGGANVVLADSDATITDSDSAGLASMVIAAANITDSGSEYLVFGSDSFAIGTGAGPTQVTINAGGGDETFNVTMAGNNATVVHAGGNTTGTLAEYQDLLRTIQYKHTSESPSTGATREFTISVNDGVTTSTSRVASVFVQAENDAPVNTVPGTQNVNEDTALSFTGGNAITIADVDAGTGGDPMRITLSVNNGTLTLGGTTGLSNLSGNGTATVQFDGTVSEVNTALDGLQYQGTLNFNGSDTLTITTSDQGNTGSGGTKTDVDTVTINVAAINDDPTDSGTLSTEQSFNEDQAGNLDLSGLTLADVDSDTQSVVVTLTASEGTMVASDAGSVTVGGSGTGTLTLTGTVANIDAYINTASRIQYTGSLNDTGNDTATVAVKINDQGNVGSGGGGDVALGTINIDITAFNDAPVVTTSASYNFGNGPSLNLHGSMSVTDVDVGAGDTMSATMTVGQGTLVLGAGTSGVNITANSAATVTFTGTLSQINNFMNGAGGATIVYNNASPTGSSTNLSVTVNDGGGTGTDPGTSGGGADEEGNSVVAINFNQPPVVDLNGASGGTGNSTTYTESNGSNTVTIAPSATVTDTEGDDIVSIVLTLSNFVDKANNVEIINVGGVDFTIGSGDQNTAIGGHTGAYSAAGDTLTITLAGGSKAADAQTLIQGMTYRHTSLNPEDGDRSIAFTVNDQGQSAGATAVINVDPVNNAPTNTVPGAQTVDEDQNLTFTGASLISIADVDAGTTGDPMRVTLGVNNGILTLAGTTGLTNLSGNGSGTVTFDGTVAEINTAIDGLIYRGNADFNGADTLTITTSDQGNRGSGGTLTDIDTVAITVNAINDDPTNSGTLVSDAAFAEDVAGNLDLSALTLADVDSGANPIVLTLTASEGTLTAASSGGVTPGGSGSSVLTLTGTVANLDAYLNTASNIQYQGSLNDFGNDTATIAVKLNDTGVNQGTGGGGDIALGTVNVDITASNDKPVVSNISGDSLRYTAADGAKVLDQGAAASVLDVDSNNFDGGSLTVTVATGGDATEDVLAFNTAGTVALAGTNAGDNVSVGGVVVGTLANNVVAGQNLVVNLNANASSANVDDLIQAITYQNIDGANPTTGVRTVDVTLTDGDGGTSDTATITLTYGADPVLDLNGAAAGTGFNAAFVEDGSAVALASTDLTIADDDAPDNLSKLQLTFNALPDGANERLLVAGTEISIGNPTGSVTVNGQTYSVSAGAQTNSVLFTYQGGLGVESTDMKALLEGITYRNDSNTPTQGARVITMQITDSFNLVSNTADTTLSVTASNDIPVITDVTKAGVEDTTVGFSTAEFQNAFTDDDGDALSAIRIRSLPPAAHGTLLLNGVPVSDEQLIAASDISGLTFVPSNNFDGTVSFSFGATDGTSFSGTERTVSIALASVNDAAVVSLPSGGNNAPITLPTDATEGVGIGEGLSVQDVDSATASGLRIAVQGVSDGANESLRIGDSVIPLGVNLTTTLSLNGTTLSVTTQVNGTSGDTTVIVTPATGGGAPLNVVQNFINDLRYANDSLIPTVGQRSLGISVDDGNGFGSAVERLVNVEASLAPSTGTTPAPQLGETAPALVAITIPDVLDPGDDGNQGQLFPPGDLGNPGDSGAAIGGVVGLLNNANVGPALQSGGLASSLANVAPSDAGDFGSGDSGFEFSPELELETALGPEELPGGEEIDFDGLRFANALEPLTRIGDGRIEDLGIAREAAVEGLEGAVEAVIFVYDQTTERFNQNAGELLGEFVRQALGQQAGQDNGTPNAPVNFVVPEGGEVPIPEDGAEADDAEPIELRLEQQLEQQIQQQAGVGGENVGDPGAPAALAANPDASGDTQQS